MSSVNSTNSNSDKYEAERTQLLDDNERVVNKANQDNEKNLTTAKEEYNTRLKSIQDQANEDVRKLRENTYDSQGRRLSDLERDHFNETRRLKDSYENQLDKERADKKSVGKVYEAQAQSIDHERANTYSAVDKDRQQRASLEKQQLVKGYQELQTSSELTQRRLEDSQKGQGERMYREYTGQMDIAQKNNAEKFQLQHEALTNDKMKLREDAEMKQMDQNREWSYRINDTHREYSKKLQDQQDLHDQGMANAQFEFDKKLQEQDRNAKHYMDDRIQAYEAQLKQQDVTFKEKERFLVEHYEEELDKMKRTNAALSQKKS